MMVGVTDSEQDLALAARDGDRRALDELIRRLYRPVVALASRFVRGRDAAEDVAQEAFARMVSHIREYDPARKFSSWAFAIAANLCRDRIRHDQTMQFAEAKEASDLSVDTPPEVPVIRMEDADRVQRALERLPFEQKIVLVLHFQHERSPQEIAESLDLSVNAVRLRLFRGLQSLRTSVKE
jgi:RNA polymerase sigma-70 factor, ECF subfamily